MVKKLITVMFSFALLVVGSVSLSACGSSSDNASGDGTASNGAVNPDAIISYQNCEPRFKLVPSNTTETCAGNVLNAIFTGLISFDDNGKIVNEVAKSINTSDNQHFDITLNNNWKFTNGESITADSFIKAWNYAANGAYGQSCSYFFDAIKGYDDLNPAQNADEADDVYAKRLEALAGKTLEGLKKINDYEFSIDLSKPSSTFVLRLAYTAFVPLPSVAFDDNGSVDESFGDAPIGNGTYKFDEWNHDQNIVVKRNDDYQGSVKAKNGGIDFRVYAGNATDTALRDVQSGQLDVLQSAGGVNYKQFKDDPSIQWVISQGTTTDNISIPYYLDHFKNDDEGKLRRKAISLAIDRQAVRNIADGTGTDAKGVCPQVELLSGCKVDVPGSEITTYNAEKAKEAWAQADAINKWDSPRLDYYYNGDNAGKPTYEAIVNSYKTTLGIEGEAVPTSDFKELLTMMGNHAVKGAYRDGWQGDYPSVENWLSSIYVTDAESNYSGYSNSKVDELVQKGIQSKNLDDANVFFTQAQAILFEDVPTLYINDGYQKMALATTIVKDSARDNWQTTVNFADLQKTA